MPGHVFLCVLELLLVRFLLWEFGAEGLTVKRLMAALDGIKLVLVRTPEGWPRLVLERMDGLSAGVFTKFRLGGFLSKW